MGLAATFVMVRLLAQLGTLSCFVVCGACFRSHGLDGDFESGLDGGLAHDGGPTVDATPRPDFAPRDARPAEGCDAELPGGCEPQDVRPAACSSDLCNDLGPPPRVYWSGHSCESLGCVDGDASDNCAGTDCDQTYATLEECEEVHSHCPSIQCRAGGGMWRFWGEDDCGFRCGVNGSCDTCPGPSCDCGPFANFVMGAGCVMDDSCTPDPFVESPEDKCMRTGGEWGPFCEPSVCGIRSALRCAAPACDCPDTMEWEDVRGCVETDYCFRGGGVCDAAGRVLCPLGTGCGEAGPYGLTCAPTCEHD